MFPPHVVLLDIRMPGIDGHTILDHLRGSPQPPTIIIVSGNHEENEARQLLQRGAFDYVTKPVDWGYLKRAIAAAAGVAPPRDIEAGRESERRPPHRPFRMSSS